MYLLCICLYSANKVLLLLLLRRLWELNEIYNLVAIEDKDELIRSRSQRSRPRLEQNNMVKKTLWKLWRTWAQRSQPSCRPFVRRRGSSSL